jgi:SAM-dependent MidA family methyltransferase
VSKLESIIKDRIQKDGPITFEEFMNMALYYPELGYYSNPDAVIGKEGDFYTSPHLHPIFGALICRQLIEMWNLMGRPSAFHAIEMGAGAGYLCKDILDYMYQTVDKSDNHKNERDFVTCLKYVIVEPYEHFKNKQQEILKEHVSSVEWVSSLDKLIEIKGCVLSNELLDAFPVHLIEMNEGLKEIYVNIGGKGLIEEKADAGSDEIGLYVEQFSIPAWEGYRTEINLRIKSWIHQVSEMLSQGFVLTIDYGYSAKEFYSEDRNRGTLLCYLEHQVNENPFQYIGRQDITSHVNFSSLKIWGEGYGFETLGYSSQGIYLTASGIDELITELYADSPDYMSEISKIKGLIMPQGMGESHRVLIQYKGEGAPELRGFSFKNEAGNL